MPENEILEIRDYKYWYDRSNSEFDEGHFRLALRSIDKAIRHDADSYMAWFRRSVILSEIKREKDAETSIRRSLELNPKFYLGWEWLGMLLLDHEMFLSALECFENALAIRRAPAPMLLTMMANICLTYDPPKALKYANWALQLEPNWEEAIIIQREATDALGKCSQGSQSEK